MSADGRNPRYDGTNVCLPMVDQLRRGDILLTFNAESADRKGSKQSSLIRRATKGRFSHALICAAPPTFVEAIGSGVSMLSLARCFAHDITNVRVLRYPDPDVAIRASQLAQLEVGRDYSVARAVRSVFPVEVLNKIDDPGIFCSALVAQVFIAAGSSNFLRTPVDRTTPATIENMRELQDVTNLVFREALAPRNVEALSALDGDRAPTPSARQTTLHAQCARQIWPQANILSKQFPELGSISTPTFYGILKFVTESIDIVEGLPRSRQAQITPMLTSVDRDLARFIEQSGLKALLREMGEAEAGEISDMLSESFNHNANIDIAAVQSMIETSRKTAADRLDDIKGWEDWGLDRSSAMAAYLPIDKEAYAMVQQRIIALQEILRRRGIDVV